MIRGNFSVDKYGWEVAAFIHVTHYDTDAIIKALENIDCEEQYIKRAYKNMQTNNVNNGLCYSNPMLQKSVIMVGKTSDMAQFFNSVFHESTHLCNHIANLYSIDKNSEDFCYIAGCIAENFFPIYENYIGSVFTHR